MMIHLKHESARNLAYYFFKDEIDFLNKKQTKNTIYTYEAEIYTNGDLYITRYFNNDNVFFGEDNGIDLKKVVRKVFDQQEVKKFLKS